MHLKRLKYDMIFIYNSSDEYLYQVNEEDINLIVIYIKTYLYTSKYTYSILILY